MFFSKQLHPPSRTTGITVKRARKEDKMTGVGEDTDKTTVHTIDGELGLGKEAMDLLQQASPVFGRLIETPSGMPSHISVETTTEFIVRVLTSLRAFLEWQQLHDPDPKEPGGSEPDPAHPKAAKRALVARMLARLLEDAFSEQYSQSLGMIENLSSMAEADRATLTIHRALAETKGVLTENEMRHYFGSFSSLGETPVWQRICVLIVLTKREPKFREVILEFEHHEIDTAANVYEGDVALIRGHNSRHGCAVKKVSIACGLHAKVVIPLTSIQPPLTSCCSTCWSLTSIQPSDVRRLEGVSVMAFRDSLHKAWQAFNVPRSLRLDHRASISASVRPVREHARNRHRQRPRPPRRNGRLVF